VNNYPFLNDSSFPIHGRLLRAGVISLLLHVVLITLLALNLKPLHTKDGPVICRVTLKALPPQGDFSHRAVYMPIPARTHIKKESLDAEIHPSAQTVTRKIPLEEKDQPSGSQKKEKTPIPLPIGELSPSDMDLNIKVEDNLPAFSSLARPGERSQNTIPGLATGEGSGREGFRNGGSGKGSGPEGEGSGDVGSGDGPGQRGFGRRGSGKGAGTGKGGSGWGGSGNGGPGVTHPIYAQNQKPAYPLEAREKGCKGEVLLKVEVLSNGHVGQIEVKRSSGYQILDQSALSAVKKWKFIPAQKRGLAISVWVNIPIRFELE
jgi:protein TonB